MATVGTMVICCDNSGAFMCKCIKVLGNRVQPGHARVGDGIVVSVQKARLGKKIKKHDVLRGILVRSTSRIVRRNGMVYRSKENAVVILNKKGVPACTRIFGAVGHELRYRRCTKILSMAPCII